MVPYIDFSKKKTEELAYEARRFIEHNTGCHSPYAAGERAAHVWREQSRQLLKGSFTKATMTNYLMSWRDLSVDDAADEMERQLGIESSDG